MASGLSLSHSVETHGTTKAGDLLRILHINPLITCFHAALTGSVSLVIFSVAQTQIGMTSCF
jgi:hypothetical protein